jgi:hypothetical protein
MTMNKVVDGVTIPLTDAEIAERQAEEAAWLAGEFDRQSTVARTKRNALLAETDWMALSDVTLSAGWVAYRQALRDVTAQAGFPHSVVWPTKPE